MIDWFQHHGVCLPTPLLHRNARRGFECHVGAVNGVERAIHQHDLYVHNRMAERAFPCGRVCSLTNRGDVLLGHSSADNSVPEGKSRPATSGRDIELHIGELSVSAGLALESCVLVHGAANGFLVGTMWTRRGA